MSPSTSGSRDCRGPCCPTCRRVLGGGQKVEQARNPGPGRVRLTGSRRRRRTNPSKSKSTVEGSILRSLAVLGGASRAVATAPHTSRYRTTHTESLAAADTARVIPRSSEFENVEPVGLCSSGEELGVWKRASVESTRKRCSTMRGPNTKTPVDAVRCSSPSQNVRSPSRMYHVSSSWWCRWIGEPEPCGARPRPPPVFQTSDHRSPCT